MASLSYIITTYNRPHSLLLRAMESIIAERIKGSSELIVVDDCSLEAAFIPPSVSAAFNGQVSLIRNAKNQGVIGSRNVGLVAARHDFVLYLDDDDVAYPNRSRDLWAAIENTSLAAVAGRTRMYQDAIYYKIVPLQYDLLLSPLQYLFNPPHINGVIWRRSDLMAMGGFDNHVPYFGEHITFLLLLLRGATALQTGDVVAQFQYLNDGLTVNNQQNNRMSQQLIAFYGTLMEETMPNDFRQVCKDMMDYLHTQPKVSFENYLRHLNQITN